MGAWILVKVSYYMWTVTIPYPYPNKMIEKWDIPPSYLFVRNLKQAA